MNKNQINKTEALKFISILTGSKNTKMTFQTFTDSQDQKKKFEGRDPLAQTRHGSLDECLCWLEEMQNLGAGIFVCINQTDLKGRRKENIQGIRAFFADKDDGKFKGSLPITPSMKVGTKNGGHYYYVLDQTLKKDQFEINSLFKESQQRLIRHFKSDKAITDVSRVMRLPGTLHQKDKSAPFRITLLEYTKEKTSLNKIKKAFPLPPDLKNESLLFSDYVNSLPTEEGKSNKLGGRDCTLMIAVKEGIAIGLSNKEIKDSLKNYCKSANFPTEVMEEKIIRFRKDYLESPWEPMHLSNYGSGSKTIRGIETYLSKNKITYSLDRIFRTHGKDIRFDLLIDKILLYCKENKLGGSKQLIISKLNVFQEHEFETKLNKLRDNLKYSCKSSELEAFTNAVIVKPTSLEMAVISHFIWQVKRKLFNLEVEHHLMPIFYGPSGAGKSRALMNLLGPLESLTLQTDLSTLKDDRFNHNLNERYILFFDEMAKHSQLDVNTFKNKITARYISYRVLGTNSTQKLLNNATFIGASNQTVDEIIKDPTSARRYYQLTCRKKCDWVAVNEIDYLKLWQSIDETSESPLIPFLSQVQVAQEKFRFKESIEEWFLERQLKPESHTEATFCPNKDLYGNYSTWALEFGYRPASLNGFGRKMTLLLGQPSEVLKGERGYRVAKKLNSTKSF